MIKMQEVSGLTPLTKNKPALSMKQALYQKNTQRTICGGDKRDRTADLCGVNAAQTPEAD
ncbi:MAG: hypothetical protein SO441_09985 [Candidatus Limivicinus sp.]|nr:hypothetical protein [Candidatus Limivicinus sp.]